MCNLDLFLFLQIFVRAPHSDDLMEMMHLEMMHSDTISSVKAKMNEKWGRCLLFFPTNILILMLPSKVNAPWPGKSNLQQLLVHTHSCVQIMRITSPPPSAHRPRPL